MPDVFSAAKRSQVMGKIHGSENRSTELKLIVIMRKHGIKGWRRRRTVFGKPDFVFSSARVAVFVDGCFWHGCHEHYNTPLTNAEFWRDKRKKNKKRDDEVRRRLESTRWQVLRIWEHELEESDRAQLVDRLTSALDQSSTCPELRSGSF